MQKLEATKSTAPFLRWAGGKTWFAKRYSPLIRGTEFKAYHEPFVGGGSFFFALAPRCRSSLSDNNDRLIETYKCIRDDHGKVIEILESFVNSEEFYYSIREKEFDDAFARSAQFIYLNQTSYNGIYRENLKGTYNVPYGYRNKDFLDKAVIEAASRQLAKTELYCEDFYLSASRVSAGDLIFIDPPYTVSHNKNGFIKYNKKLFSIGDFERLRSYIEIVREKGALYILTNADHDYVRKIFDFGDAVHEVTRASLIGGKKAVRGPISELVFTNLGGQSWQF